jgi:hypothetical protein
MSLFGRTGFSSLVAALTFGTGSTFDRSWSWENLDGTTKQRHSGLSL